MSRKKSRPNNVLSPSPPRLLVPSPPHHWLAWLIALLVARWLLPTEGAAEGLTLWLTQLVLFTAVARMAWGWRFEDRPARFDWLDGAMGLLIAAQVISALVVVFTVGNARAAINVAWEWIGSGVLIWLLRQELKSARVVRELCVGLSLTATVLAGYGLWQHYVWYPQMVREYEQLVNEELSLTGPNENGQPRRLSASDAQRLARLRTEMARQGVPTEASSRTLWEQRLKASREPIGLFALANSFAGLLLAMGLIIVGSRNSSLIWNWSSSVGALLIAFCLLLTKSRTAWVGLLAGMTWWGLRAMRGRFVAARRSALVTWAVIGVLVVGVAVTIAVASGGLDKAVLSEAPKSLRYRLEYWQGTWGTIREHLWLGTGPGNFREHYLKHKLPESSEEIADPHNFVLDVWATSGMVGLIGLLACAGMMVRTWLRLAIMVREDRQAPDASDVIPMRLTSSAVWGAGLSFPVAAIGMELLGHGTDERLWWLGGIWWLVWLGLVAWQRQARIATSSLSAAHGGPTTVPEELLPAASAVPLTHGLPTALEAANVALLVHLLGAGGIAMPAITQLLWLVWVLRAALSTSDGSLTGETFSSKIGVASVSPPRVWLMLAGWAGALFGLCLLSGTLPELTCRTWLGLGDAAWETRNFELALERCNAAAASDRFALEPLERQAELAAQRAEQTNLAADIDAADERFRRLIDKQPFASHPHRRLGQFWLSCFERTRDAESARRAAAAFAAAVERYPYHAGLLSEWALACDGAGRLADARSVAERALRQDDVNRRAGHVDKFLSTKVRQQMENLADVSDPERSAGEAN